MRFGVRIITMAFIAIAVACSKNTAEKAQAQYTGDAAHDMAEAMKLGDLKAVKSFVDKDPSILEGRDSLGRTPLHVAALLNNPDLVNFLIDKGMDPNVADGSGMTPMALIQETGVRAQKAMDALGKRGGKMQ